MIVLNVNELKSLEPYLVNLGVVHFGFLLHRFSMAN